MTPPDRWREAAREAHSLQYFDGTHSNSNIRCPKCDEIEAILRRLFPAREEGIEPPKFYLECRKCGYSYEGWAIPPKVCPNDGWPLTEALGNSVRSTESERQKEERDGK